MRNTTNVYYIANTRGKSAEDKKKKAKKTSNAEEAKDLCKDRMAVKWFANRQLRLDHAVEDIKKNKKIIFSPQKKWQREQKRWYDIWNIHIQEGQQQSRTKKQNIDVE